MTSTDAILYALAALVFSPVALLGAAFLWMLIDTQRKTAAVIAFAIGLWFAVPAVWRAATAPAPPPPPKPKADAQMVEDLKDCHEKCAGDDWGSCFGVCHNGAEKALEIRAR